MIVIDHLSKKFKKGDWALRELTLTIPTGMFGLLGPNGAGKTTLMRILATLLPSSSGQIDMNHQSLTKHPEAIRKAIGYLPQYFQIYPQLTGYEFMEHVAVMKGISDSRERRRDIEVLLEKVNLTDKAFKKVKTYSGGMKQRLGIAQAMLASPEILIIDEPTAGLDPEEKVRLRNVLSEFSVNRTILLSTHIVADIESSCQQLAVLNKGRLAFQGTQEQLQQRADGYVWQVELSESDYSRLLETETIQLLHSRRTPSGMVCKLISDQPSCLSLSHAVPLTPTLEDGYLAVIGGAGE